VRYNHIDNGDDNVAIGSGSSNLVIEHNQCLNGHGTSIGSIGEDNSHGEVSNIFFFNNTFYRTQNVARIKTWQGGTGFVRNITYKSLRLEETQNSILITQYYCPGSQHSGE
jgi:polygalacturonase